MNLKKVNDESYGRNGETHHCGGQNQAGASPDSTQKQAG
jgi:hypothetical protein